MRSWDRYWDGTGGDENTVRLVLHYAPWRVNFYPGSVKLSTRLAERLQNGR